MLTDKDKQLLGLLKLNARESVASLARKLGVSRTTVQDRLRRLEVSKVIDGYYVRLAEEVSTASIRAFVTLEVEPRRTQEVTRALVKLPAVSALYTVSGKFDLVVLLAAENADELDRLLDRIGEVEGVTGTESAIILSTKLERR